MDLVNFNIYITFLKYRREHECDGDGITIIYLTCFFNTHTILISYQITLHLLLVPKSYPTVSILLLDLRCECSAAHSILDEKDQKQKGQAMCFTVYKI